MWKIIIIIFLTTFLLGCQIGSYEIKKITDNTTRTEEIKDSLIKMCSEDFNYNKDISEKKYDVSISILEQERVEDIKSAKDFYSLWGSALNINQDLEYNWEKLEFPIVLFAIKFKGEGGQIPMVIACGKDGKLMKFSKSKILLSNTI